MSRKILIIIIVPTALLALFGWLGVYGLQGEEPRRALISIEMLKDGDYIFPHMFGWMYYNKPPLFNWLMVGFFQIMGTINEWAVRMPSTLSIIFLAFLNWKFARNFIDDKTALFSSFFILTNAEVLFYGSVYSGEIDLFFALLVYLQVMSFFIFFSKGNYLLMYLISYFIAALSFMTKALPAIPFQVLTIGFVLLYFKKWKLLFTWQHLLGILVFSGIILGYIALLATENQETQFIIRQFKEASQRTGIETSSIDTIKGSLVFPFRIILLFLPWSVLLVFLFSKKMLVQLKQNRLIVFTLIFMVVNLPIYWFTGDFKSRYIYPFIPFISILLGFLLSNGLSILPKVRIWLERFLLFIFILVPIAMIAVFFIPILKNVSVNIFLQLGLIAVSVVLLWLYFRLKDQRILLTILLLFVVRLGFNNTFIQTLKTELKAHYYQEETKRFIDLKKKKKIFLSGHPMQFESEYNLGPIHFKADSLKTAPYIAFQIPYYITLQSGNLVYYEEKMSAGKYYLVQERFVDRNILQVHDSIHDYFTGWDWLLVTKD